MSRRSIPDAWTVREFCTDSDTICWANCNCSLTLDVAPNTNTICMALAAIRIGMEPSMVLNANVFRPMLCYFNTSNVLKTSLARLPMVKSLRTVL